MKKMMRSGIAIAVSALLALSACGNNQAATDTASAEATAGATEEAVTEAETSPSEEPSPEAEAMKILALKGPTGMGMSYLMKQSTEGASEGKYSFELASAADEAVAALTSGSVDVAAIPANLAATLYNKTDGGIQVLALNTLNNLYILSDSDEINSIADLSGKTLHASGQGAVPEYVLAYLLEKAGITMVEGETANEGECAVVWHAEHSELAAEVAAGTVNLALLPEPHVEVARIKNENMRIAIDMGAEWGAAEPNSVITTGVVAVRKEYAQAHPDELQVFMAEYANSVYNVNATPDEAGEWIAEAGILDNAALATSAIPASNIVYIDMTQMDTEGIDGTEGASIPLMSELLDTFLNILYTANPKSVGGALPGADFYYQTAANLADAAEVAESAAPSDAAEATTSEEAATEEATAEGNSAKAETASEKTRISTGENTASIVWDYCPSGILANQEQEGLAS